MDTICDSIKQQIKDLSDNIKNLGSALTKAYNEHNKHDQDNLELLIQNKSADLLALQADFLANGCRVLSPKPPMPMVPIIRILIVLDGIGTFWPTDPTDQWFGLSELFSTLSTSAPHYPRFALTKRG